VVPYQQKVRELAVYRSGPNDPDLQIVLVHGAIDRAAGMIRIARRLKQHEVIRYDRRGYGRSANAPATGTAMEGLSLLLWQLNETPR
jgi:pimeloyl-ACP methyl ester carboxylesterase